LDPQKFEQKEKEDASAGQTKGKSKASALTGRATKKTLKMETVPSPHGQRVIPHIDAALIGKAEAAAARKKKAQVREAIHYCVSHPQCNLAMQEKKEAAALNFDDDIEDEDAPKPIAERLGIKSPLAGNVILLVIKFRCLMNALINREKQGGKGEEATETT
jgi:hypothetical protein